MSDMERTSGATVIIWVIGVFFMYVALKLEGLGSANLVILYSVLGPANLVILDVCINSRA